jgi:DNA-binding transcriptional ArsR family regulator
MSLPPAAPGTRRQRLLGFYGWMIMWHLPGVWAYTGSNGQDPVTSANRFACPKKNRPDQEQHLKPHADITDTQTVKALSHPLRVQILRLLEEKDGSPVEIATALGLPVNRVSYHMRQLARFGLIKLVKRTPRRGAVEHHYRLQARPRISDKAWGDVPEIVKQAMTGAAVEQILTHVHSSAGAGGFDRSDAHLSRSDVVLDERGWHEISEVLARTLKRVDEIHAASSQRLKKSDHAGQVRGTVVLALLETLSAPDAPPADLDKGSGRKRKSAAAG